MALIGRRLLVMQAVLAVLAASPVEARRHRKSNEETKPLEQPAATPSTPAPAAEKAASAPAATPAPAAVTPVDASSSQDPCLRDSKCNEIYERARALSRANQYEAALVMYQQTYAMKPLPWLLLNVGRIQQKLGRHDQAAATYRKLLDFNAKMPTDEASTGLADVEVTTKAREYLKQAEAAIAEQRRLNPTAVVTTGTTDKVPLYKKWWFWTIIGGSVGIVAVGVGLGIGLSNSSTPRAPNGIDVLYPTFN
jgi:tetratricopeptide (TPR) repeat protein